MDINHPIENLMKSTMENLKEMIDVNTIVGEAVEAKDGSLIIPISKVSFGFASGGSEFSCKGNGGGSNGNGKYPFGGGSGAGVSVKPVAFLVINSDGVRLLGIDAENTYDKIIDSIPQIIDTLKCAFKKDCNSNGNSNSNNNSTNKPFNNENNTDTAEE